MSRCDTCAYARTCGFRDDWTEDCYKSIGEEGKNNDGTENKDDGRIQIYP